MAGNRDVCVTCRKEKFTYPCEGCSQKFCLADLQEHQRGLSEQLNQIVIEHDRFRQTLIDQRQNPHNSALFKQIDRWERTSIASIQQAARECRDAAIDYVRAGVEEIDRKLVLFTAQLRQIRDGNDFSEVDLKRLTSKLTALSQELVNPANVALEDGSEPLVNKVQVTLSAARPRQEFAAQKWKQHAVTVAGGNGEGRQSNQLFCPGGIYVDENKHILIADWHNHRIVRVRSQGKIGTVVAGGNGGGKRKDQLNRPTDAIIDKHTNSLIIADYGNRRVIRQYEQGVVTQQEVLLDNIDCWGLAMDKHGFLYVSDQGKHEVRRWKLAEKQGILVAGGNGRGDRLNQLDSPTFLFVDDDGSILVSDRDNHRVVKMREDAKEGVVIAGGNRSGSSLSQLYSPGKVLVDRWEQIYVADEGNDRVMRWCEGAKEGEIVAGGDGRGQAPSQLCGPHGLSFDDEGNLYVSDQFNHRVQRFDLMTT